MHILQIEMEYFFFKLFCFEVSVKLQDKIFVRVDSFSKFLKEKSKIYNYTF